jgi:ABC-type antimicrobial peptide transport system permease subunit
VRRALESVDATVPIGVETRRGATSLELELRRAGTVVMGAIGVVGLLLAAIGLYGVMAYLAAARTAEVGIRMALGASVGRIRRHMLEQALGLVAYGLVIGGAVATSLAPALRSVLVGVGPLDPVAFVAAATLLAGAGLAAGLLPAQRAARVEPLRALRHR